MRRRWRIGAATAVIVGIATALGLLNDGASAERIAAAVLDASPIRIEAERTPSGVRIELRL